MLHPGNLVNQSVASKNPEPRATYTITTTTTSNTNTITTTITYHLASCSLAGSRSPVPTAYRRANDSLRTVIVPELLGLSSLPADLYTASIVLEV